MDRSTLAAGAQNADEHMRIMHEEDEARRDHQLPLPFSCRVTLSGHHVGPVQAVRFSGGPGEYVLSGGADRRIILWNPQKAKHVKTYDTQHGREVMDIQLSRANDKFASGSADKLAMVWDVSTGAILRRLRGHEGAVHSLAWNDDESVLVTGSYDQTVRLWDSRSYSRDAVQVLRDARDAISCVRVRGAEIATASMDGTIRRYDLRTAKVVTDYMGAAVSGVTWSHDGECLLVSCLDSTRKLLDKATGSVLNEYHAPATDFAMEACFDNSDGFVLAGDEEGLVRAWDLVTANEVHSYKAHAGPVTSIAWHPKEKHFVSAGVDGLIRLWT